MNLRRLIFFFALSFAAASERVFPAALSHPLDLGGIASGLERGVVFPGWQDFAALGRYARGAGDVNGDGYEDYLIGMPYLDVAGGESVGETFLIYGAANGMSGVFDLRTLNAPKGVAFVGKEAYDRSGLRAMGAGDVNRDGFADILISALLATPNGPGCEQVLAEWETMFPELMGLAQGAFPEGGLDCAGEAYLIFGSPGALGANGVFPLGSLDGQNGVMFHGASPQDRAGVGMSGLGDIDGDGFADMGIGAGGYHARIPGRAYVFFGTDQDMASTATVSLGSVNGANGFVISGPSNALEFGVAMAGAGDVNGDGFDDFLVGDRGPEFPPGYAYLIYGGPNVGASGALDASALNGTNGAIFQGIFSPTNDVYGAGWGVSGAGDVNGDGFGDFLIGSYTLGEGVGDAYLIYGRRAPYGVNGLQSLGNLDAATGLRIRGVVKEDQVGYDTSAGDFNGDGYFDLLLPGFGYDSHGLANAGAAFAVYGGPNKAAIAAAASSLAAVNGTNGVRMEGTAAEDWTGFSAGNAGDTNADGFMDIILGAVTPGTALRGKAYFVPGAGTATSATYRTFVAPGNPPPRGVGMVGDGTHSIPASRVWIDFAAGDDGAGGASLATVHIHRPGTSTIQFGPSALLKIYEWEIGSDRQNAGAAALTFKGAAKPGVWGALVLASDDGGLSWSLPPQTREESRRTVVVTGQLLPRRYALVLPAENAARRWRQYE